MADSDWVDDEEVTEDSDWVDDDHHDSNISALESAGRGLVQGSTAGFADELGGAVQGGLDSIYGLFGDSPSEVNARLAEQGFTGDVGPTSSGQMYTQGRDEMRELDRQAKEANPSAYTAGEIGGGIASSFVPGLNLGKGASLAKIAAQSAAMGGAAGLGLSDADLTKGEFGQAAWDTAKGAAVGGAIGAGSELAARGISALARKAPEALDRFAEKAALNATGATGKQLTTFSDDAGRQLLDRGIVRFGDSQRNIATRAADAVKAANSQIDDSLRALEAKGVKVDANDIYNTIRAKIDELAGDPSQADIAKMLEGELDNLLNATEARGSTEFGVGAAEKIKRGYNRKAGNWADPEKGAVGKEMYQTFRGGVEDAAEAADPATAALFKEGKESYGLLRPIEEAAERRAATTAQSPVGGLLDTAAFVGAEAAKGGMGIPAAIARRVVSPRISSSVAVGADTLSKIMKVAPQRLGKFAKVLQAAEQRGPKGIASTHFILQQTNPEYRQVLKDVADAPEQNSEEQLYDN